MTPLTTPPPGSSNSRMLGLELRARFRSLARSRGHVAIVVSVLALGIAASALMVVVVDSVVRRPLPYGDADRLVAFFRSSLSGGARHDPLSPADFEDFRRESRTLDDVTAAHPWSPVLTGEGEPDRIDGLRASPSLFAMLGARPELGPGFDDSAGADERVVVLGHDLWQRRFGGDRRIVGRTLQLDGEEHTVVGVAASGFRFPPFWNAQAELWAPLRFSSEEAQNRRSQYLRGFARLRPGVTLAEAGAELGSIAERQRSAFPETNRDAGVRVEPLKEPVVRPVRGALYLLLGAAGLVLLIASANVANLTLVRALGERSQIAIRSALGASRGRIARGIVFEIAVLVLASGALGLVLAAWGVDVLAAHAPASLPRGNEIGLGGDAAIAVLLLTAVSGLVVVVPALGATLGPGFGATLPPGARASAARSSQRCQRALVVVEVALASTLLVSATLLLKSFRELAGLDPGFQREAILTMNVGFAGSSFAPPGPQRAFLEEILRRVRAQPSVADAALVNHLPIGGDIWRTPFLVDGMDPGPDLPRASYRVVSPGYFRTLGIALLSGRDFDERDRDDGERVGIVNRTLAERYLRGRHPVGESLRLGDERLRIVGVAEDVRQFRLADDVRPEIYFPYAQNPAAFWTNTSIVVRSVGEPRDAAREVRASVWSLDRNLPVSNVRTVDEILAGDVWRPRFHSALAGAFALVALALAGLGLYGVIGAFVRLRDRELGIRLSLGATPGGLARWVVGQGMALAGAGLAIGAVGSLLVERALAGLLFGVSPHDPAGVAVGLGAVAAACALAVCIPAARASRVAPATVLRQT